MARTPEQKTTDRSAKRAAKPAREEKPAKADRPWLPAAEAPLGKAVNARWMGQSNRQIAMRMDNGWRAVVPFLTGTPDLTLSPAPTHYRELREGTKPFNPADTDAED